MMGMLHHRYPVSRFSEWLKQKMLEKHLSQTTLGAIAQIPQQTISTWVNDDRRPTLHPSRILTLSKVFGVKPEDMLRAMEEDD
jgi:plasmid maintenance system antidote protein VapI